MQKRSFKDAKKAYHEGISSKLRKKKEVPAQKLEKQVRKPKGVLGHLVDDEEEIEQQRQAQQQKNQVKKWFDDVPAIDDKESPSQITVSQIEALYKVAVREYQSKLNDYQNSHSRSFEEEVC